MATSNSIKFTKAALLDPDLPEGTYKDQDNSYRWMRVGKRRRSVGITKCPPGSSQPINKVIPDLKAFNEHTLPSMAVIKRLTNEELAIIDGERHRGQKAKAEEKAVTPPGHAGGLSGHQRRFKAVHQGQLSEDFQ